MVKLNQALSSGLKGLSSDKGKAKEAAPKGKNFIQQVQGIHNSVKGMLPDNVNKTLSSAFESLGKNKMVSKIPGIGGKVAQARNAMKVAEAAGDAGKAASSAEAAGGAAEAAGGAAEAGAVGGAEAGAAAGGPVGIAILAAIEVGKAAYTVTKALITLPGDLKKFSDELLEGQRGLAEFSGSMANVFAKLDIANIQSQARVGEGTAGSANMLVDSQINLTKALETQNKFFTNAKNVGTAAIDNLLEKLARLLEPAFETMNQILEALFDLDDSNADQPWFLQFANEVAGRENPKVAPKPPNPYKESVKPIKDFFKDPAGTIGRAVNPFH